MNLEDYKSELKAINEEFESKKYTLIKTYCQANSKYNIGDTVTDHIGTIRIEKYVYNINHYTRIPELNFFGAVLKKDLTPTKKGEKRTVYASNIEKQ